MPKYSHRPMTVLLSTALIIFANKLIKPFEDFVVPLETAKEFISIGGKHRLYPQTYFRDLEPNDFH